MRLPVGGGSDSAVIAQQHRHHAVTASANPQWELTAPPPLLRRRSAEATRRWRFNLRQRFQGCHTDHVHLAGWRACARIVGKSKQRLMRRMALTMKLGRDASAE